MFENDVIHAFQRSKPKSSKVKGINDAIKQVNDGLIQETNSSSIVSKRSVEKLYYKNEPEYFRYFVGKLKRRSPLINRGYWLRMRAVEHTVEQFLAEPTSKQKVIINLGCGYDPLPWLFLGKQPQLCSNAKFIDVDYPALMRKKIETIKATSQLQAPLHDLVFNSANDGTLCDSSSYAAIGCDLINLDFLRFILKEQMQVEGCSVAILFVAEVSIAYMDYEGSQAVIEWASAYEDVRFCLLEQHLPDGKSHPFAQTMLKHFDKLRTPLRAIGTMQDMCQRFVSGGWPALGLDMQSLWRLWSDPTFLTNEQRRRLDDIEPFDEWEELALFASHYFLLVARKGEALQQAKQLHRPQDNVTKLGQEVVFKELPALSIQRRFAAIVPSTSASSHFGIHGGLGARERLADVVSFASESGKVSLPGPTIREGLMCHTITQYLDDDCLLVGGRASPEKVSKDCWMRTSGEWTRTHDLPEARHRHCAVAVRDGVLILGGKTSSGKIVDDPLHWTPAHGWQTLQLTGDIPPARFGAAMCIIRKEDVPADLSSVFPDTAEVGMLLGGMSQSGTIYDDLYIWHLTADSIVFKNVSDYYRSRFGQTLARFGARLLRWQHEDGNPSLLLIGGVGFRDLLTRDGEILNLTQLCAHRLVGPHPLFVGFDIQRDLVVAGGATCFSFGTNWNEGFYLRFSTESERKSAWHMVQPDEKPPAKPIAVLDNYAAIQQTGTVTRTTIGSADQFEALLNAGIPVIIHGADIGPCTSKWTPEYLKAVLGKRKVVVHSSENDRLDFRTKNFRYETQAFDQFISSAQSGRSLYLRALSIEAPSEKPTTLATDYPEIADDFILPSALEYVVRNAHSSPLRIASAKTTMWLHYDVMANVLCQVHGSKKLILFPPSDIEHLGIEAGASSSSFDVFDADLTTHSSLRHCHPHEAILGPGDVLLIPALWCHSAAPTDDISIAVNVFFRDLREGYAAGKDVYGNRDLAAYERSRKDIAKIAKSFDTLPASTREFYLKRLALELRNVAAG